MEAHAWFSVKFDPERESMGDKIAEFMEHEITGDWHIVMHPSMYITFRKKTPMPYIRWAKIPPATILEGVDPAFVTYYDFPIDRCNLIPLDEIWFIGVEILHILTNLADAHIIRTEKKKQWLYAQDAICPTCNRRA